MIPNYTKNIVWHLQTRLKQFYDYDLVVDGSLGKEPEKSKTLAALLDVLEGDDSQGVIYGIQKELNDHIDAKLKLDGSVGPQSFWDKSKTLNAALVMLGGVIELPEPEVEDIVKGSSRFVDKIVIHCSATPEGREVSSDTIASWHKERGFSNRGGTYVGYHYLIHLDGSIEPCKPEGVRGTHAYPWNDGSIGICYIGGVALDGKTPKDTRTPEQKKSLEELVKKIVKKYKTIKTIVGHRDVPGVAKACPCFDVKTWWESVKK